MVRPILKFDSANFWSVKLGKNKPVRFLEQNAWEYRKDINKHQTVARFTCLFINFHQVLIFQQLTSSREKEKGGEREREEPELKAECPLGIQAAPCPQKIKNKKIK